MSVSSFLIGWVLVSVLASLAFGSFMAGRRLIDGVLRDPATVPGGTRSLV
jgi:hypothetical protein